MTNALDTLPEHEQEHVRTLLNMALDICRDQMGPAGGFSPLALSMNSDGRVNVAAAADFAAPEAVGVLTTAMREHARTKGIVAAAVCSDILVTLADTGRRMDAIRVRLESASGFCVDIFQPYTPSPEGVRFESVEAQQQAPEIFVSGSDR